MRKLVIIRGPSGTGKSTIGAAVLMREAAQEANGAKKSNLTYAYHETDQFFTDSSGVYHFKLSKLSRAHKWNLFSTERSMLHGTELVVVSNTFCAHWEMEPYFELSEEYEYDVEVIRTPGPWDPKVLDVRNEHSVPFKTLERQINGYMDHPDEVVWQDMGIFKNV